MSGTFTEKELVKFLEMMKNNKSRKRLLRFHVYGIIEQDPGDSSDLNDVLDCLRGYGTADVIHVEVVDEKETETC